MREKLHVSYVSVINFVNTTFKIELFWVAIGKSFIGKAWKTYFMCLLLSDCTNTVVIRLKNKSVNQILSSTNNLVWRFKKWEPWHKKRKTSSQSRPCELNEDCSLLEINCSSWAYIGISNKLLCFSWHIYMVLE